MLRKFSLALCVLTVGLLAFATDEASARGGRRSRCGSSCGSSCGTSCCTPCAPCGTSSCAPCASGVCSVGGAPVHTAAVSTQATLIVSLPADARLIIDGNATTSTSGSRLFHSRGLENGFDYYHVLEAEVVRDGRTERVSQRVIVRAGQETRVSLDLPTGIASR